MPQLICVSLVRTLVLIMIDQTMTYPRSTCWPYTLMLWPLRVCLNQPPLLLLFAPAPGRFILWSWHLKQRIPNVKCYSRSARILSTANDHKKIPVTWLVRLVIVLFTTRYLPCHAVKYVETDLCVGHGLDDRISHLATIVGHCIFWIVNSQLSEPSWEAIKKLGYLDSGLRLT